MQINTNLSAANLPGTTNSPNKTATQTASPAATQAAATPEADLLQLISENEPASSSNSGPLSALLDFSNPAEAQDATSAASNSMLNQSTTALLAQGNLNPQSVLDLLSPLS